MPMRGDRAESADVEMTDADASSPSASARRPSKLPRHSSDETAVSSPSTSASSTTASSSALATLPHVILQLVFSFAVKDLGLKVAPIQRHDWRRAVRAKGSIHALRQWKCVCRDWRDAIPAIVAQYENGTARVNLSFLKQAAYAAPLEQVARVGDQVRDLRVVLHGFPNVARHEPQPEIPWDQLLQTCPNLERLDLSKVRYVTREELAKVITSAGTHCVNMRVLILPLPEPWNQQARHVGDEMDDMIERRNNEIRRSGDREIMSALATAMQRWHESGNTRGLQQLVLYQTGSTADQYLSLLARFAARIELVDAWKLTYFNDGWDALWCDEYWRVGLATWEAFCRTSVELREFNWVVVPFRDAFFRPFGATKRWRLRELYMDIAGGGLERGLGEPPGLDDSGCSSQGLRQLVSGLPRLSVLRVGLNPRRRIDLNAFDDDFFVHLARSCPGLKQLWIADGRGYTGRDAMEQITDRGMYAIGQLPYVEEVVLQALDRASSDVALALIRAPKGIKETPAQRDIKLMVLEDMDELILTALAQLVTIPESELVPQFALQIATRMPPPPPPNPSHFRQRIPVEEEVVIEQKALDNRATLESLRDLFKQRGSCFRFQAFLDTKTLALTHVNMFSTAWRHRDVVGGAFFRMDILYDAENDDDFEWIVVR